MTFRLEMEEAGAMRRIGDRPGAMRVFFAASAAALAAACGDVVVETLSNRGVFGSGRFTDGSNADVVPVTVAGIVLLGAFLFSRLRTVLGDGPGAAPAFRSIEAALTRDALVRLVPAAFAAQIALLFAMETVEQILIAGHTLGGTIWLGGPVAISLAVHAAFCAGAIVALRALVAAFEPRAVRFIRALLAILSAALRPRAATVAVAVPRLTASLRSPALRHIGKRGPPRPDPFRYLHD